MKANSDPGLDEIRAVRHRISAEMGHDPKRLARYLKKLEKKYPQQIQRYHDWQKTTAAATQPKEVTAK